MNHIAKEYFTFYEVGGKVRDELIGLKSSDVDYTVVYNGPECSINYVFSVLEDYLKINGYKIFLTTPECFTIRAMFPQDHPCLSGVADFVLARHEIGYIPNTRTPMCVAGTLEQDLLRRDFTVNALAKDPITGNIIDPFKGREHLKDRILVTPDESTITLHEDPLRAYRAIRFAVTKGFVMHPDLIYAINMLDERDLHKVSVERVLTEITKCCKHDSVSTFKYLFDVFPTLGGYAINNGMWFLPTLKSK